MSLHMPITKKRIRNHLQYSFWKYAILVIVALFGWNLIYTTTRYRPPEDKKVEFYVSGYAGALASQDRLQELMDAIHQEVLPDMEEVTYTTLTQDETYGDMQLMVWISAAQGDVYLLDQSQFENMAGNGAMLELQPFIEDGALHVEGVDLKKGYVKDAETGEKALYGIPADTLTGLNDYNLVTEKKVLCVLAQNGNDENSIKFLDYLLTHMQATAN
ncbi:MAG: hypothetical protein PHY12_05270 [Eubacteriales bacterium]|nr:hypothetical protein [Eubacteriales bacterium]